MKIIKSITAALCVALAFCATAMAQEAKPKQSVLITNAKRFDGKSEELADGMSVLVEGNTIAKIAKSITAPAGATVIDAGGRTMTPGFIAAHEHMMLQMSYGEGGTSDERYYAYVATQTANTYITRGFTTTRDAAGNTFSLEKAIDRGIEVLRQATSKSAELLALSGPRDPYPGKKGVIEEGALADLLLVNGDPLKDISILTNPEEYLALIMKDGTIYKNTVK